MFENTLSQKHFQTVVLEDRREDNPSILDGAPLAQGLATHSEGRALPPPHPPFSLNDSWKENAIQLNTLRGWTLITQSSLLQMFIHSSAMSNAAPSAPIFL